MHNLQQTLNDDKNLKMLGTNYKEITLMLHKKVGEWEKVQNLYHK